MKNLLDCKNEVARIIDFKPGIKFPDWASYEGLVKLNSPHGISYILKSMDKAAELYASQFKASPSSEKPDFEKIAMDFCMQYWGNDRTVKEMLPEVLEHIWNDYVLPEKELNLNLIQTIGEKDKEIEELKAELSSQKEAAKQYLQKHTK